MKSEARAKESKSKAKQKQSKHPSEHKFSGDDGVREPPVPIPNTEVKPHSADGTWLETARESRSLPESI